MLYLPRKAAYALPRVAFPDFNLQVIADFANGEIQQAASLFNTEFTFEDYIEKSFFKTASLIAASAKSAAIFSGVGEDTKTAMYEYGRHLGLAFQVCSPPCQEQRSLVDSCGFQLLILVPQKRVSGLSVVVELRMPPAHESLLFLPLASGLSC